MRDELTLGAGGQAHRLIVEDKLHLDAVALSLLQLLEGVGGGRVFIELQRLSLFAVINSVVEVIFMLLSQLVVPTQANSE